VTRLAEAGTSMHFVGSSGARWDSVRPQPPLEQARRSIDGGQVKGNDGLVLRLSRFFPFSRALVYRALTEPGELARWWGPHGFSVPEIELDLLVGGSYRIAMQPPEGEIFFLSGEFTEVAPPARVAYTFRWSPPDPDDRETTVALSLDEQPGGTVVHLTHSGFATDGRRALHEAGWSDSFARLEQVLAETTAQGG